MISSCMFSRAPIAAKNRQMTGIAHSPRRLKRATSIATSAGSVPRRSTTTQAPPTKRTTAITSPAATKPRGTAVAAASRPTGARGTEWYVPATTIRRPVVGSSRRSNAPDGRIQVSAAAAATPASRRMSGCGSSIFENAIRVPATLKGSPYTGGADVGAGRLFRGRRKSDAAIGTPQTVCPLRGERQHRSAVVKVMKVRKCVRGSVRPFLTSQIPLRPFRRASGYSW